MKLVYSAPKHGDAGFADTCRQSGIEVIQVENAVDFVNQKDADLFIDAAFEGYFSEFSAPLLFHAPAKTFGSLKNAPLNSARFCAWPGFWERPVWEIAPKGGNVNWVELLSYIGIGAKLVKDTVGLIAPRILCTIINEAVFTISDGVAGAKDIDTAMKLGTNYPLGPMEWAKSIGAAGVLEVLEEMSKENIKYKPHADLARLIGS